MKFGMKFGIRHIIMALAAVLLLAACNSKPKAGADASTTKVEADSATVGAAFDSLVVAESRAQADAEYAQSDAYAQSHEEFDAAIDQLTQGMSATDRQLYLLGCAVSAFARNSQYFATHTSEMANPANQRRMALYGQKIKEYREVLITSQLNESQQRTLDSLNAEIQF